MGRKINTGEDVNDQPRTSQWWVLPTIGVLVVFSLVTVVYTIWLWLPNLRFGYLIRFLPKVVRSPLFIAPVISVLLIIILYWYIRSRSVGSYYEPAPAPAPAPSSKAKSDVRVDDQVIAERWIVDRSLEEQDQPIISILMFYNGGDEPYDFSGISVSDDAGRQYEFPEEFMLNPGESVQLHQGTGEDTATNLYVGSEQDAPNLSARVLVIVNALGDILTIIDSQKGQPDISGSPRKEPSRPSSQDTPQISYPSGVPDSTMERVLKSIPIEIITGWIFLRSLFESNPQDVSTPVYWAFFLVVLVFTFIFMAKTTNEQANTSIIDDIMSLATDQVRLGQTVLGVTSFIVWAISLGAPFNSLSVYNGTIAAAALAVYTIIVLPLFQRDSASQRQIPA